MIETKKHLILGFFAFGLTLSTLFLPMRANNSEDMKKIGFGYPFRFISQDFSRYDAFSFFPRYQSFEFKKLDTIREISYLNLFLSFISIFFIVEIIIAILETIKFKRNVNNLKGGAK